MNTQDNFLLADDEGNAEIIPLEDKKPSTNWKRVARLYRLLRSNTNNLGSIPNIITSIIKTRSWENYDFRGNRIKVGTFREFVEAPPPEGLGTTIDALANLCQKHPEIVEMIDETVQEQSNIYKPPKKVSIVGDKRKSSTSTSLQRNLRLLRRLAEKNQKAENLREQVLKGEITSNAALIKLGKKKRRFGVEATTESLVRFIESHFSKSEIKEIQSTLKKLIN